MGIKRDCTCQRVHHEHGDINAYRVDRCRCDDCRHAATLQGRIDTRRAAYGTSNRIIDNTAAAEHIKVLMDFGMLPMEIARRAGVSWRVMGHIVNNGKRRSTLATVNAILAVSPNLDDLDDKTLTSARGTRLRLQALLTVGWPYAVVGREAGLATSIIREALRNARVTAHTARAIRDTYDRLWNTEPVATSIVEARWIGRAKNMAAERGYAPPMALDDDLLDTPFHPEPSIGQASRGADLDEFMFLIESGVDPHSAAARLGVQRDAIENAARRQHRDDVLDRIYPGRLVAAA